MVTFPLLLISQIYFTQRYKIFSLYIDDIPTAGQNGCILINFLCPFKSVPFTKPLQSDQYSLKQIPNNKYTHRLNSF